MATSTAAVADELRRRLASRSHAQGGRERENEKDGIEELRRLLTGDEQARIARVEASLAPEALGRALPGATIAARTQGEDHAKALGPTVVASIRDAVEKEPRLFIDAIVPAMGPAIRAAVTHALRALVQQLNETLSRGLSLRGLGWRLEAVRTGRPFAEVVLLRSLVYRVEQIFLIHRESGLVIEHLVAPGSPQQDPDQVAAMLTAIDAFVHDAFREDAQLGRFHVGDLVCWVEHGPMALLVAVVRGTAPDSYADVLREAQERIHLDFAQELASFRGDATPFAAARPVVEKCLQTESAPLRSPSSSRYLLPAVLGAILVGAAVLVGVRMHRTHVDERRFQSVVEALRREPGVLVTDARNDGGRYTFEGLRDPLAASPRALVEQAGARPGDSTVRFAPFYSLDVGLSERRAVRLMQPPPGVTLSLTEGGVLRVAGSAPGSWIERARVLAPTLPGVDDVDWTALVDVDARAELGRTSASLASMAIFFQVGSAEVSAAQHAALDEMADATKRMLALAPAAGVKATLDLVGRADSSGTELENDALSGRRAERIAGDLRARGVPSEALRTHAGGVARGADAPACGAYGLHGADCARSVELRPDLQPAAPPPERAP